MIKKKIFFFIPILNKGGAERVLQNIASGFSKFDYSITIIFFSSYYVRIEEENSINYKQIHSSKTFFAFFKILRLLKKNKPDFVISSLTHINILLIILKKFFNLNFNLFIRESNLPHLQIKNSSIGKIIKFSYKYLYKFSDMILCSSPLMIRQFNEDFFINKNKLKLLYNPVNAKKIITLSKVKFDFKTSAMKLVSVGRLEYQKGFDILIDVLSKTNLNFILYIIGSGSLTDKLLAKINEKKLDNKIVLLGASTNPYKYIKNADYTIQLSRWEGVPNIILESLLLGKKTIFLDNFSIFESFKLNFKNLIIINKSSDLLTILKNNKKLINSNNLNSNLPTEFYSDNVISNLHRYLIKFK